MRVGDWVRYDHGISTQYIGRLGQVTELTGVQDGMVRVSFVGDTVLPDYGCYTENLVVLSPREAAIALAEHALGTSK